MWRKTLFFQILHIIIHPLYGLNFSTNLATSIFSMICVEHYIERRKFSQAKSVLCSLLLSVSLGVVVESPHTKYPLRFGWKEKSRALLFGIIFFFVVFFFARYYIVCWTKTRKQKQKKPKHTDKGREIDTKGRQKIHNRYTANLLTYKTSQPASERANVRTFVCLRSLDGG